MTGNVRYAAQQRATLKKSSQVKRRRFFWLKSNSMPFSVSNLFADEGHQLFLGDKNRKPKTAGDQFIYRLHELGACLYFIFTAVFK